MKMSREMWTGPFHRVAVLLLGILVVVPSAIAEPAPKATPTAKTERQWKQFLVQTRLKEGSTRAEVEKELQARVIEEFDRDHGFALFRDVYYELDVNWSVYIFYRSPRGASITPDTPRLAMRSVVLPKVIRNTPGARKRIQ